MIGSNWTFIISLLLATSVVPMLQNGVDVYLALEVCIVYHLNFRESLLNQTQWAQWIVNSTGSYEFSSLLSHWSTICKPLQLCFSSEPPSGWSLHYKNHLLLLVVGPQHCCYPKPNRKCYLKEKKNKPTQQPNSALASIGVNETIENKSINYDVVSSDFHWLTEYKVRSTLIWPIVISNMKVS